MEEGKMNTEDKIQLICAVIGSLIAIIIYDFIYGL